MKKILIAKPNNNIYLKNREDRSKTDLQSSEILAFSKALLEAGNRGHFQEVEIYLANDINACFANNVGFSQNRRAEGNFGYENLFRSEYVYGWDVVPALLEKFNEDDILIVFCGVWDDSTKCQQLLNLVEVWTGKIYYVLNDLRLQIPEGKVKETFLKKETTILTQARKYKNDLFNVEVLSIECLPFYYVDYSEDVSKAYDVIYPYLNWTDIGDYRKERLRKFGSVMGVSKLWVGASDIKRLEAGFDSQFYAPQKHNELQKTTKMCRASFIVNEKSYNEAELLPNRFYESLILGVMPLIDHETADAVKDQIKHISRHFDINNYILNHDFSDMKEKLNDYELLYKTNELGQRLRMHSNERINMLKNFREQLKQLISNEH